MLKAFPQNCIGYNNVPAFTYDDYYVSHFCTLTASCISQTRGFCNDADNHGWLGPRWNFQLKNTLCQVQWWPSSIIHCLWHEWWQPRIGSSWAMNNARKQSITLGCWCQTPSLTLTYPLATFLALWTFLKIASKSVTWNTQTLFSLNTAYFMIVFECISFLLDTFQLSISDHNLINHFDCFPVSFKTVRVKCGI